MLGVAAAICVWLLQNCVAQSVCLQLQRLEEVVWGEGRFTATNLLFILAAAKLLQVCFLLSSCRYFFVTAETKSFFVCVCCCKVDFAVANLPLINFCSGRSKGVTAKCLFAAADQGFAVTGLILAAATLKLWTGPPVTTVYSTEPGPSQEGT